MNFQQMPRKAEVPILFQYQNEPKALFTSVFNHDVGNLKSIQPTGEGCIMNFDYCLAGDTKIALINGETDTLKNICDRVTAGEDVFTFSINPKTEEIEVSKVLAGRKTRVNERTLIVHLDNGERVVCSDNHKFLLRNGQYLQAKELEEGMSLMGFSILHDEKDYGVTYRTIGVNRNFMGHVPEHTLIYKYFHEDFEEGLPIHHKDRNGLNNSLDNLEQISSSQHFSEHMKKFWSGLTKEQRSEFIRSHVTDVTREKVSVRSKKWWKNLSEEEYKAFCKKMSESCPDRRGSNNIMWGKKHTEEAIKKMSEKRSKYNLSKPLEERKSNSIRMTEGRILKNAKRVLDAGMVLNEENYNHMKLQHDKKCGRWENAVPVLLKHGLLTNHKIVKIEQGERMDLYDIEVEKNHNFPLASGIFVHNSALEMRIAGVISGDETLLKAFQSGKDLHKSTASLVWNVPIEEVSKDLRTKAKSVNFGR